VADFSQPNYDVKTAIDGKQPFQSNGWAVSGQTGRSHWATFETKTDLGSEGGTVITVVMNQNYTDGKHTLGKFRISVTTHPRPVGLGTPGKISQILAIAPADRTPEQKRALLDAYGQQDEQYKKLRAALAEAQKPLPPDAKLAELQKTMETAKMPVPDDPQLVELRQTVEMSKQQLANKRLTAAQDLAWALINTPAFLFNH
jgi:hypothetical protein